MTRHRFDSSVTESAPEDHGIGGWWGLLLAGALTLMTLGGYVADSPHVGLPLSSIGAGLVAAACLVTGVMTRRWFPGLGWVLVLWLTFLVPFLVHRPLDAYGQHKSELLLTASLLAAAAPVLLLRTSGRILTWAASLFAFGGLVSLLALIFPDNPGRLSLEGTSYIGSGRLINLALAVALVSVVLIGRRRWLVLPVVLFTAYLGLRTGSRGPFLAAFLATGVVAVARRRQLRRSFSRRTAIVVVISLGLVVVAASGYAVSRFAGLATGDASTSDRLSLFRTAALAGLRHPLGVGWGNLAPVLADAGLPLYQYPHNLILEVFAEAGWLAALVLVACIAAAFRRAWAAADSAPGGYLLAILTYFLFNAMVSADINVNRVVFTAVFACWCLPAAGAQPWPARLSGRWAGAEKLVLLGQRLRRGPQATSGIHRK